MSGFRLAQMTVPDKAGEPRVAYLVPVDDLGRKTGPTVIGELSKTAADKLELGQVLKVRPTLAAFTPLPKRPEPVEE